MLTSTTGRLTSAAIAAAAGLAVLAPAAANAAPAAPAAKPAKLTVPAYTSYLQHQAAKSPAAKKVFKQYLGLSQSQKATLVANLQDHAVYAALKAKAWGKIRNIHTVDQYNKSVSFVTDVTFRTVKDKVRTTTATFTVTEKIFQIPVTTETVTLTYQTAGKATKLKATAKVTNLNAAIAITASGQATRGKETHVNIVAVPTVKSFGSKIAKVQSLRSDRQAFLATLANK